MQSAPVKAALGALTKPCHCVSGSTLRQRSSRGPAAPGARGLANSSPELAPFFAGPRAVPRRSARARTAGVRACCVSSAPRLKYEWEQVIPGMSDYPYTQMPGNCMTTDWVTRRWLQSGSFGFPRLAGIQLLFADQGAVQEQSGERIPH